MAQKSDKSSSGIKSKKKNKTFSINEVSSSSSDEKIARSEFSINSKRSTGNLQEDSLRDWTLVKRKNEIEVKSIDCSLLSSQCKALLVSEISNYEFQEYDELMAEALLDKRKRMLFYKEHRREFDKIIRNIRK